MKNLPLMSRRFIPVNTVVERFFGRGSISDKVAEQMRSDSENLTFPTLFPNLAEVELLPLSIMTSASGHAS